MGTNTLPEGNETEEIETDVNAFMKGELWPNRPSECGKSHVETFVPRNPFAAKPHCRAFPERAPCVPPQKQEDTLRKAFCLKS